MATLFQALGAIVYQGFTTAERDDLNAKERMVLYNTTTDQWEMYLSGVWRAIAILDSDGNLTAAQHGTLGSDLHPEYARTAAPEEITTSWILKSGGSIRTTPGSTPAGEIVVQVKTSSGAPSHSASQGTLCFVAPDDYVYVNNTGSTSWTKQAKNSDLHTEYLDSDAITAVEGEATLDLGGAVTVAGDFAVDTPVFFVDAGDNFIGMGTVSSNTDNQVKILMTATKDILIDGSTNPREIDTGVMRFEQKPAIVNTRCITLNIDIDSQPNTHGMVINMVATQLDPGETINAFEIVFDSGNASGGHADALEVSAIGSGLDDINAIHVNPGVDAIHQDSGTFGAVEKAFKYDGSYTDTTTAFNSTGTDVQLFVTNGDVVYIGMAAKYDHIEAILETAATGAGVKPTFAFSDGSGGFTPFTPVDETLGFRQNGIIEWELDDIGAWAADEVNSIGSKYWIRITRTQGGAITGPTEDTIQVQAVTEYGWDKVGDVSIKDLTAAGDIAVGGTVDGVDIAARDHARYDDTEAVTAAKTVKLDDFTTPDDNTDLDASTSKHGLLKKLGGGTTNFLRADGTWNAPAGGASTHAPIAGYFPGVLGIGIKTTPQVPYWGDSFTPATLRCRVAVAPVGADIRVRFRKNGSEIGSTYVTITDGNKTGSLAYTTTVSDNDYFDIDIKQVGANPDEGSDLVWGVVP